MRYIIFCLVVCTRLMAADWLCTEEASQRQGNTIQACGVARGKTEDEARSAAFDNAKKEFDRVCNASSDCNRHAISVNPKRTDCRESEDSYSCYRLVEFSISTQANVQTKKNKDVPKFIKDSGGCLIQASTAAPTQGQTVHFSVFDSSGNPVEAIKNVTDLQEQTTWHNFSFPHRGNTFQLNGFENLGEHNIVIDAIGCSQPSTGRIMVMANEEIPTVGYGVLIPEATPESGGKKFLHALGHVMKSVSDAKLGKRTTTCVSRPTANGTYETECTQ